MLLTDRMLGNMKLKKKLLFSFAILTLVPIIVVGTYAIVYIRNLITDKVENGISTTVQQSVASMNYQLQRYEQILQYIMLDNQNAIIFHNTNPTYYDIYYNMEKVYAPMLISIQEMNPEIGSICVYTENESLLVGRRDVRALKEILHKPLTMKALSSYGVKWDIEGNDLVAMGRISKMSKNSPNSVVCMRIPVSSFLMPFSDVIRVYGLALYDGERMLTSDVHPELQGSPDQWRETTGRTAVIDGVPMMIVRKTLEQTGWQLIFGCPYRQLSIDLSPLVNFIGMAILVCAAVMTLVSVKVASSVTRRISALNASMSDVETGTLLHIQEPWEKDEIGDLTRHFSRMIDALDQHIKQNYQNQLQLRDAEIKMLQSQINPHFLYNIISMINWMALEKEEIEISEVLIQFSKFYRMILNRGNYEVSIRDEIEHITCYLDLQKRMHDYSFDVSIEAPPEVLHYRMLGVILQPIVENAIQHGIDMLRNERGMLKIRVEQDEDQICFFISDNGPGMLEEQFLESLSVSRKSYGLKNVNERLKIAYGDSFGLSMDPSCKKGTTILVRIPVIESEPLPANTQMSEQAGRGFPEYKSV